MNISTLLAIFGLGATVGAIVIIVIVSYHHSLGEDKYLIPELIKIECGEYNKTTGIFELRNHKGDAK